MAKFQITQRNRILGRVWSLVVRAGNSHANFWSKFGTVLGKYDPTNSLNVSFPSNVYDLQGRASVYRCTDNSTARKYPYLVRV